ncbi:YcnI family protein [Nocardioides maradonensis]
MRRSLLGGIAALPVAPVALVALGAPALAHVTVNPDTAPGGGYTTLSFRVPTESDTASTTKLQVYFPADQPFGSVAVRPVAGWRYRVVDEKLKQPITTDDGQVSQAVSQITWTATSRATAIKPGEFQEFSVSLGPLPDSGSVVFKVLQTYSDGEVARWIQPTVAGQAEPEHPAPTLTLAPAGESSTEAAAGTGSSGNGRSDWALGLSGLAVVIAAGGTALGLRRKGS